MSDKPISKETLVGAKLYIINPEENSGHSIGLWVEHTGGIEFPVIESGGLPMFNSASTEFAGSEPVELSDEFYKGLVDLYHEFKQMAMITPYHYNMAKTEVWVLEMIHSMMKMRQVPFEIEWLIEEARRKMKDYEKEAWLL